jgi:hypothetical protein
MEAMVECKGKQNINKKSIRKTFEPVDAWPGTGAL